MLGLWFQRSEGAKFWLAVLNELKQRGVRDVLICCVNGLKGFPEAIEAVFPHAWVQTCIVHLIRQSLRFVPDKHRRVVAKDLKPICTAVDADAAAEALATFEAGWGERYPMIGKTWRDTWEHVIPFLLTELADHLDDIVASESPKQAKELLRLLVKDIRVHNPPPDPPHLPHPGGGSRNTS